MPVEQASASRTRVKSAFLLVGDGGTHKEGESGALVVIGHIINPLY
jgi:hypothetical protein